MIYRSSRYEEIHEQVWDDYGAHYDPARASRNRWWDTEIAPKWRNRVGLPRLTAEEAASEASALLNSINAGMFRNDPELDALLREARAAAYNFSTALTRDNWRRFKGEVG